MPHIKPLPYDEAMKRLIEAEIKINITNNYIDSLMENIDDAININAKNNNKEMYTIYVMFKSLLNEIKRRLT